jgi:hypothetical protein
LWNIPDALTGAHKRRVVRSTSDLSNIMMMLMTEMVTIVRVSIRPAGSFVDKAYGKSLKSGLFAT